MKNMKNFCAKLCLLISCASISYADQELQNMELSCREKIELICIGDDALTPKFAHTMEAFISLARERYSKEMACDPLYEAKLRYYIESEEKDVLVYMLDEELVYLERHMDDASVREKLWKKYFLDADGYMAELDQPIIFFWLLYSDAVPASIYREAWVKYFRGDVDKLKTGEVMLSPKDMYEGYFKNIRDRLVPLAGNHEDLKKNTETNSAYRTDYYHNFKEFVKQSCQDENDLEWIIQDKADSSSSDQKVKVITKWIEIGSGEEELDLDWVKQGELPPGAVLPASDAVDEDVERAQVEARRARADVMEIRAALPRAAAARWELRSGRDVVSLPIPPAEWSVLKTALSHTEPTPPPAKRHMVCIMYRAWVYLVLLDSKGQEICRKWMKDPFGPPVDPCWMPRSAAESLSPHRSVSIEPEWTLPDADYTALMSLPSLIKIYELEKTHFREH